VTITDPVKAWKFTQENMPWFAKEILGCVAANGKGHVTLTVEVEE